MTLRLVSSGLTNSQIQNELSSSDDEDLDKHPTAAAKSDATNNTSENSSEPDQYRFEDQNSHDFEDGMEEVFGVEIEILDHQSQTESPKRKSAVSVDDNDIPTKTGRPQSVVREHFRKITDTNGKTTNICKRCKTHVSDQAHRMKKHLEKCILKSSCKPNSRDFFKPNPPVAVPELSSDVPVSVSDAPKKVNTGGLKQSKLIGHLIRWDTKTQEDAAFRMGKFFFSANIAFHVAQNSEFKSFVNYLNPSFSIPSHDTIGGTILDKAFKEIEEKRKDLLKDKKVVLLQDGWSTNQSDSVIGHCLYTPKATHFFSAENVQRQTKSAEFCLELFEKAKTRAETELGADVIGLVTDNCNTMLALHTLLKSKFPHLHAYGCNPHLMNLLEKHFTPEDIQDKVAFVQKYFRNHDKAKSLLQDNGGGRPVLPNATRWNSQIDSFRNFCKNQHRYLEISRQLEAHSSKEIEKLEKLRTILNNSKVYPEVKKTLEIMEPISTELDKVQRVNASISDAVHSWLSLLDQLPFRIITDDYFNKHKKLGMTPAAIAAYMVDPRYKGQNLNETDREMGLEWLSAKSPSLILILSELKKPDSSYFFKPYNTKEIISTMQPRDWWKDAAKSAVLPAVLSVIDELLSLPAGTANIERSFSTLGSIITKQRNRLDVQKASKLCSIINHYKIMRN